MYVVCVLGWCFSDVVLIFFWLIGMLIMVVFVNVKICYVDV